MTSKCECSEEQSPPGLRERKRQRTMRSIIDAATSLVLERGFDAVKVEDICEAADISKRTFFNYVTSKDDAVIGRIQFDITDDTIAEFLSTPVDNIVTRMIDVFLSSPGDSAGIDDPDASATFDEEIRRRRHAILAENSNLYMLASMRYREATASLQEVVAKYFAAYPDKRRLPDLPVAAEAYVVIGIIREACWFEAVHRNDLYAAESLGISDASPITDIRTTAATVFTSYGKELPW